MTRPIIDYLQQIASVDSDKELFYVASDEIKSAPGNEKHGLSV